MTRKLPDTASVAHPVKGARLHAPSAARNAPAICDLIAHAGPGPGKALELASGTGQHVVAFAERFPDLHWQPTEIDSARRASIDAYIGDTKATNVAPARDLNATQPGWGALHLGQTLIVVVNLLHLISTPEARTVIREAAQALAAGGRFVVYGPFMRAGALISDGDRAFHASLSAGDPEIGYKDDFDVLDWLLEAGLEIIDVIEMPANNLGIIAARPDF